MQGQNTIVAEHERLTIACCGVRIESDYGYARDLGRRGNGRPRRLESCPYKTVRNLNYVRDTLALFIVCVIRCSVWAAIVFALYYAVCDYLCTNGLEPADLPTKIYTAFLQLLEAYQTHYCQTLDFSPYGEVLEEYLWLYYPGANGFLLGPDLE